MPAVENHITIKLPNITGHPMCVLSWYKKWHWILLVNHHKYLFIVEVLWICHWNPNLGPPKTWAPLSSCSWEYVPLIVYVGGNDRYGNIYFKYPVISPCLFKIIIVDFLSDCSCCMYSVVTTMYVNTGVLIIHNIKFFHTSFSWK